MRPYANFYAHNGEQGLEAAANVAVVVDDLDTSDEAMNLLARHNIPFKVLKPADLKSEDLEGFDVLVVFAKPDRETCERIAEACNSRQDCRACGGARLLSMAER